MIIKKVKYIHLDVQRKLNEAHFLFLESFQILYCERKYNVGATPPLQFT